MITTAHYDDRTDTTIRVPNRPACPQWCTTPEHCEPEWDHLYVLTADKFEASDTCTAAIDTIEDTTNEGRPMIITVGLERDLWFTSDEDEPQLYPARVTVGTSDNSTGGYGGYEDISPKAARRLAGLLNVAADRLEYRPAVTA